MGGMRQAGWVAVSMVALSGLVGGAAGCASGSSGGSAGSGGGNGATKAPALGGLQAPARNDLSAGGGAALGPALGESAAPGKQPQAANGPLNEPSLLPKLSSSVIKTADVRLRVDHGKFQSAMRAARRIAGRYGGYTTHSSSSGTTVHDGTITLRVPAFAFNKAVDDLEGLGRLTGESVTGQDVGAEFVDLHARLVNLESQEQVLRRLMTRAQTIAESIRVETYLQQVEFQIEDVQGRILYLQKRTSMSTITITMHEAGKKPAPPQHASALWKAGSRSLHTALAVVTSVIVGAGLVVPVAILALLALLAGRRLAPLATPLRGSRPAAGGSPSSEA